MASDEKEAKNVFDRTRETLQQTCGDRKPTPKEVLERRIEHLENKLRDLHALYRALPDEMSHEASRALRNLFSQL